ncbi:MAG: hypothetical protein ACFHX7_08270 [Pseudomonadota bacterium]
MVMDLTGEPTGTLIGTTLFLFIWGLMTLLVWRTMAVTLKIRPRLTWQGTRRPMLIIRGTGKGDVATIPLHAIDAVEVVQFTAGWGKSVTSDKLDDVPEAEPVSGWKRFFGLRTQTAATFIATTSQYDYQGPGLRVSYRATTPATGTTLFEWKHQFPTRHPARLSAALTRTEG